MNVRRAEREDLPAIARMAHGASVAAYGDLVDQSATVAPYAIEPQTDLKRQLLAGSLLVCCEDDQLTGFAEFEVLDDHVNILDMCHGHQGTSVAAALTRALQTLHPHLPLSHDVVLGHLDREQLHEAIGFVPGETIDADLGGHTVVARRWWLPPLPPVSRMATG